MVQLLVDYGADLFYTDTNGYCALQLAQINEHQNVAEFLMFSIGKVIFLMYLFNICRKNS